MESAPPSCAGAYLNFPMAAVASHELASERLAVAYFTSDSPSR